MHTCNFVEAVEVAEILHMDTATERVTIPHAINCRNILSDKIENAAQFGVCLGLALKIIHDAERVVVQLFENLVVGFVKDIGAHVYVNNLFAVYFMIRVLFYRRRGLSTCLFSSGECPA